MLRNTARTYLMMALLPLLCAQPAIAQSFTFMELNCENLFDCRHDSLKRDYEFCEGGEKNWDFSRYWRKLNNIARTIVSCGETEDGDWIVPDFVALAEVENDSVLTMLTKHSLLKTLRYEYVMTDSPDERGIDVALLYSPFSFALENHYSLRVEMSKGHRPTRDILYAVGQTIIGKDEQRLHVFVLHAPSRSGGEIATEPYRMLVSDRLCQAIDSIRAVSPDASIIVAGDFNDYHDSKSVQQLSKHGMHNISARSKGTHGAEGTYFFQGEWGSLDQILVSESLLNRYPKMRCAVNDAEFLTEPDAQTGGIRPLRTYRGPAYNPNGFSDHLPLVLRVFN